MNNKQTVNIMIEFVKNFLEKYNLISSENTFLVGFSGGCDSISLLDILKTLSKKYGFRLVAAHLNHNWRGEESLQEEKNCEEFCKKNKIEYVCETLENTVDKSENSARESRYEFFVKHAKKYKNCTIFTAHSASDNAETLIYRIIKGTGIKGLQGILPERKIEGYSVFRPLLGLAREEIEGYCISRGLVANTDSSNFDINYKRNFIRHKIMPLFKEINYNAPKAIVLLAKIASNQNKIVEEYLNLIKPEIYCEGKILTPKFKNLSKEVRQKIIYDRVLEYNLDYDFKKIKSISDFIEENWTSKAGSRYSITSDLWLFVNKENIYLIDKLKNKKDINIKINNEGKYKIPEINGAFSLQKYKGTEKVEFPCENALCAYVEIKGGIDFELRTRKDGDFINPFGMKGTMKLKKYLNSKGIVQHEKDSLLMLCSGSEVFWVIGVGLSDKFKVVNKPSHVLEFRGKCRG